MKNNQQNSENFSENQNPPLIRVEQNEKGEPLVSARELYAFFGSSTNFTNWCKRMFEYSLVQGQDFTPILAQSTGGRPSIDYALTLDCAKQISMLQKSEKGKQARQYFIDCEKKLVEIITKPQHIVSFDVQALEIKFLKQIENLEKQIQDAQNAQNRQYNILLEVQNGINLQFEEAFYALQDDVEGLKIMVIAIGNQKKSASKGDKIYFYVYLIYDPDTNRYKIGMSNNPEQRLKVIKTTAPNAYLVSKIAFFAQELATQMEKFIHSKFGLEGKGMGGEWFSLDEEDLNWLERMKLTLEKN